MKTRNLFASVALSAALVVAPFVAAQESSYTPGTVWEVSGITVKPGQFENYMDYLAGAWKKMQDFGVKEGWVVSYRVFAVSNPRAGEPDLYLVVEYKDYATQAQRLDFQKKMQAHMAADARKMDKGFGDRETMRTANGSMEMVELKLK